MTHEQGDSVPKHEWSSRAMWVTKHFSHSATYWHDVYSRPDVKGQVYRNRQSVALDWALSVTDGEAAVADVGTGAGHLALALARQGLAVTAIDASETMINQVTANAASASLDHLVASMLSDAHQLQLPSSTFDVVTAIGLLPWVEEPGLVLAEMARITKPGGHVIATMDNSLSLSRWLDPGWRSPVRRLKEKTRRRIARRSSARSPVPYPTAMNSKDFDRLLRTAGLKPIAYRGVGFGPFTFLGRAVVPNSLGLGIDQKLQGIADRDLPPFRSIAVFHVVLAMKSA